MLNFSSGGFNFGSGGGGDKKSQYLMIGALVLVIVGSLGFMGYWFFSKGHSGVNPMPNKFYFYCVTCNKEIVVSKEVSSRPPNGPATGGPPGLSPTQPPPCPECHKNTLVAERRCPSCGHYFVTDWDKTNNIMMGMVDPNFAKVECPECHVNIADWSKAHPPK